MVFIAEPVEYLSNDGVIYDRHVHFKVSNKNKTWTEDEFTIKITIKGIYER